MEHKPWYRLLKVLYIGAYLIGLLFIGMLSYLQVPHQVKDYEKTSIVCESGETYNLSRSKISEFSLYEGSDDDLKVRRACQPSQTITNDKTGEKLTVRPEKLASYGLEVPPLPSNKNYTLKYFYTTQGSWQSVLTWFAIGFLVIFIALELIKTTILYVLGISIWRGGLFYAILILGAMFSDNKNN